MTVSTNFEALAGTLGIVDPFQKRVFATAYGRIVDVFKNKAIKKEEKINQVTAISFTTAKLIEQEIQRNNHSLTARHQALVVRHSDLNAKVRDLVTKIDLFVKKNERLEEENKNLKKELENKIKEATAKQEQLEQKELELKKQIEDCHKKNGQLIEDQIKIAEEFMQEKEEIAHLLEKEETYSEEFSEKLEHLESENKRLYFLLEKFEQIKREVFVLGILSGIKITWDLSCKVFPNTTKIVTHYTPNFVKIFWWACVAYTVCICVKKIYQIKYQE